MTAESGVSRAEREAVAALLGREPRGLRAVAVVDDNGEPQVIRVASLVDDKPFPTLFWLVDKTLGYRIDQVEAGGLIKVFQQRIDASDTLQASMVDDHRAYIALRNQYLSSDELNALKRLGFYAVLQRRGIGGIEDFSRIRCLHTWYGAHLVVPNTVGKLLDDYWHHAENG